MRLHEAIESGREFFIKRPIQGSSAAEKISVGACGSSWVSATVAELASDRWELQSDLCEIAWKYSVVKQHLQEADFDCDTATTARVTQLTHKAFRAGWSIRNRQKGKEL